MLSPRMRNFLEAEVDDDDSCTLRGCTMIVMIVSATLAVETIYSAESPASFRRIL